MQKAKPKFICQKCGAVYPRQQGQCYHCSAWNSIVEEAESSGADLYSIEGGGAKPVSVSQIEAVNTDRLKTGIGEFDRVTGGGIVPGSIVLIGGSPGIGKSTLLLSVSNNAAAANPQSKVLYISGEESPHQIKLRAERLKIDSPNLYILAEIDLNGIIRHIKEIKPILVIIDSIQTMIHPSFESAPGSVSQVRECAGLLQRISKKTGIPIMLVGHVTKSGSIAGPMVLEHIVDTVLFFEGENVRDFRILRTLKNRFGSTQEIGVFSMETQGLKEVENPSEFFLSHHSKNVSGSAVVPVNEGTRTILVEIQALVTPSGFGLPARRAEGVSANRLSLLLAVMEKRLRMPLGGSDVFVNAAGGVEVDEPAVDLGIVLAAASSLKDIPLPPGTAVVGEIGLGGELRGVSRIEERVKEVSKMGFQRILIPEVNMSKNLDFPHIQILGADTLKKALHLLRTHNS